MALREISDAIFGIECQRRVWLDHDALCVRIEGYIDALIERIYENPEPEEKQLAVILEDRARLILSRLCRCALN